MLLAKNITNLPIEAKNGSIGRLKDCLFDENHWTLRYFVADTGKWLPGRKVLLSPMHFDEPESGIVSIMKDRLPVSLTKEHIENSPSLGENMPISRQYEIEYARYYQQNLYWNGPYFWGVSHMPEYHTIVDTSVENRFESEEAHNKRVQKIEESSLRSLREVTGYKVNAQDDDFGHIHDFLIDEDYWRIHYLIVDSKNWLPGKKFLIDIDWIESFNWVNKTATVGLTKKMLQEAPEFDSNLPLEDRYVDRLYDQDGMRPRELPLTHSTLTRP
jgi:hypothetical protein